jgi:4-amino-4-deoxy-L-arabinose transferase-like glycosyltransferase
LTRDTSRTAATSVHPQPVRDFRRGFIDYAPLTLALFLYLIPAVAAINLAAPNEDDALTVIPLLQLVNGEPIDSPIWKAPMFGREVPWVVGPYTGLLHPVLNTVGFWLFGYNLPFIRLIPALYGAATLVLTYVLARSLFSSLVAGAAVVTLAVSPAFVFWHWLEGYHSYISMAAFSTASLLCFLTFSRTRRKRFLILGAFFCGVGLATKLNFVYWIVFYAIAIVVFAIRERRWLRATSVAEPIMLATIAFAVGASPWLTFAYFHQPLISSIVQTLLGGTSAAGVSNASVVANVGFRFEQLNDMLAGRNIDSFFACSPPVPGNELMPFFLAVGYVGIVLALLFTSLRRFGWLPLAFLVFVLPLMVVLSAVTPTGLTIYNGSIYFPVPHLIIAVGAVLLLTHFRGGQNLLRWLPTPIAAILLGLVLAAGDIRHTYAKYEMLHETNGCGQMAGAMNDFVRYLDDANINNPISMDWGLYKPLYLLSEGRVRPSENFVGYYDGKIWSSEPPPIVAENLVKLLADSETVYLFHTPQFTNMRGRLELLERMAAASGREVVVEKVFKQGDGKPLFMVVRVH